MVARLQENLPLLAAAVRARFDGQSPPVAFQEATTGSRSGTRMTSPLGKPLTGPPGVLRYRQHKRDGTVVQAEWPTNFSVAKLGSLSFYRTGKSRCEIENQDLNDGKDRPVPQHPDVGRRRAAGEHLRICLEITFSDQDFLGWIS